MLTMIDRFSRYSVAIPLKDSETSTIVSEILRHWVYKFGTPIHILSDNGTQFRSHAFKAFTKSFGIKHLKSTVYHPPSNGMIERLHRYVNQRIVLAAIDQNLNLLKADEWKDLIPPIMFAYNATVNRMTGYAPYEIIFGRRPVFPIDLTLNLKINKIKKLRCQIQFIK